MKTKAFITAIFLIGFLSQSCSKDSTPSIDKEVNSVLLLDDIKSIEIEILELINSHRITKNLEALQVDELIRTQTNNHTNYMIKQQSASHDYFFQRKEFLETYAEAIQVSENVAAGYTNAQSVVRAWLNSPSHKSNIEDDHSHFNVSANKDSEGKWYFTNIFIKAN
ncbi:CAP domain-containing protein [Geojedonia litorea]|uniref:CAP domain-containing protein n=1 Tax=Geojedonia litorea TaxID=1268269 RepID=A0ABV9N7L1_9FLAO